MARRDRNPQLWAALQNELANSLTQTPQGDRAGNIEQAIAHYEQSLQVRTRQAMPVEWATTTMNLGTAYSDRIRGERAENLEQAIAHYEQSTKIFERNAFPDDHRRVYRNLGNLFFAAERPNHWADSVDSYRQALAASELLYQVAATAEARRAELGEIRELPTRLAYAMVRVDSSQGALVEAVTVLEENRARWLSEALALQTDQPSGVPDHFWQAFTAQRDQVQALQDELRLPESTPGRQPYLSLSDLLRQARVGLQTVIQQVQTHNPDFMPDVSFVDIQAAAQDAPLVYLLTTSQGGLAAIVDGERVQSLPLDFTDDELSELLRDWYGAYARSHADRAGWWAAIERGTGQLWDRVMGPLAGPRQFLSPGPWRRLRALAPGGLRAHASGPGGRGHNPSYSPAAARFLLQCL